MNAVIDAEAIARATAAAIPSRHDGKNVAAEASPARAIAIVLLGTGVVGGALLKLLKTPAAANVRLVGAANSRWQQIDPARLASRSLRDQLNDGG